MTLQRVLLLTYKQLHTVHCPEEKMYMCVEVNRGELELKPEEHRYLWSEKYAQCLYFTRKTIRLVRFKSEML